MESTELIIDVRTREEYVKEHIKGALNIPLYDLDFYLDFLKDKSVTIYCDTRVGSKLAEKRLRDKGIEPSVLKPEKLSEYKKEGKGIVCATNYVIVRPGFENAVHELAL